jgi:hypothetical protein
MPEILEGYLPKSKHATTSNEEIQKVLTNLIGGSDTGTSIDNGSIIYAPKT